MPYYFLFSLFFILSCSSTKTVKQDSVADWNEKERHRWNSFFTNPKANFNRQPNQFLVESVKKVKPGTAVDIGMGQGRNSLFLARQGWRVTGFDVADEAVNIAREQAQKENLKIQTLVTGDENFDFGVEQWDLVAFIYEGCLSESPETFNRIRNGLRKKGLLVFEFFHRDHGIKIGRLDFGCTSNTERELFEKSGSFNILKYEEVTDKADFAGREITKIIRLLAEKK